METLAVVLATRQRPDAIRRLVPEVLAQAPGSAEILIVDQSEPEVCDAVARAMAELGDPRVRHLPHQPPGLPAARNAGIAATAGRIVLFLDDDVELYPGCLVAHLAAYRDPAVGGVVGRIEERRLRPNAWRTTNRIGRSGRIRTRLDGPDPRPIETLKGANMSLRRRAIEAAGGFDPGFGGSALLEDADLSTRVRALGWTLRYEPDAAVVHRHDPAGGVRTDGPDAAWWRLHNTARYVRRHHGPAAAPGLWLTSSLIALREGLTSGDPRRVGQLLGALGRGWRAKSPRLPGGVER